MEEKTNRNEPNIYLWWLFQCFFFFVFVHRNNFITRMMWQVNTSISRFKPIFSLFTMTPLVFFEIVRLTGYNLFIRIFYRILSESVNWTRILSIRPKKSMCNRHFVVKVTWKRTELKVMHKMKSTVKMETNESKCSLVMSINYNSKCDIITLVLSLRFWSLL